MDNRKHIMKPTDSYPAALDVLVLLPGQPYSKRYKLVRIEVDASGRFALISEGRKATSG